MSYLNPVLRTIQVQLNTIEKTTHLNEICQTVFREKLAKPHKAQHLNNGKSALWTKGNINQPEPSVFVRDKGLP